MDTYGEFSAGVGILDSSLAEALSAWQDETAASYVTMHDGMKSLAAEVWARYQEAVEAREIAKANYSEDEFDAALSLLAAQINDL